MQNYALMVCDRDSGKFLPILSGKAKSRRQFIKLNAEKINNYRNSKFHWKVAGE